MKPVTVLVIEKSAAEAALVSAALALHPTIRVLDAPDAGEAAQRLGEADAPIVLALAGGAALAAPPADFFRRLDEKGIPVVGIAAGLSPAEKSRALDAGVRELHERPPEWRPYAELVEAVVMRFIRTG